MELQEYGVRSIMLHSCRTTPCIVTRAPLCTIPNPIYKYRTPMYEESGYTKKARLFCFKQKRKCESGRDLENCLESTISQISNPQPGPALLFLITHE